MKKLLAFFCASAILACMASCSDSPTKVMPYNQGINIIPTLERCGIEFQYGDNVVTWISLLLF